MDSLLQMPDEQRFYTTSLPVISKDMIDEWRANGHRKLASLVRFSNKPSVFSCRQIRPNELRIWDRGIPSPVQQFVDTSLEIFGTGVVEKISTFFETFDNLRLDRSRRYPDRAIGNRLIGQSNPESPLRTLRAEDLAAIFAHPRIDPRHAQTFSTHLFVSLEKILAYLPSNTLLWIEGDAISNQYDAKDYFCERHPDDDPYLIIHLSDPGTPYFIENCLFRTACGHVTAHGGGVDHAHASAPYANGAPRPRVCIKFQIHIPG